MKDVVLDEVMKELIISKKDFEKYFKKKNIVDIKQYNSYIKTKSGKSREK